VITQYLVATFSQKKKSYLQPTPKSRFWSFGSRVGKFF